MTVAMDVDGVLRDFTGALVRKYAMCYPSHRPIGEFGQWDLRPNFPEFAGDIEGFAFRTLGEEIMRHADPYPGALAFAEEVAKRHRLVIVTSQFPHLKVATLDWLHGHKVPYHSIMLTHTKTLVRADVLIDDAVHNLKEWATIGLPSICVARPWNREWPVRCETYGDALFRLRNLTIERGGE
jgi:5'(3')-deoxyribonucleotidase